MGYRFSQSYLEREAEPGHAEVIEAQFTYAPMLLGLSMLGDLAEEQGVEGGVGKNVQTPDEEPDIEEKINEMARAVARVILHWSDQTISKTCHRARSRTSRAVVELQLTFRIEVVRLGGRRRGRGLTSARGFR